MVQFSLCLSFAKRGDRLLITNAGTSPSVGAYNSAPGVLRATALNGLLPVLAYDQYLCAAGVLRQLDFDFRAGDGQRRHPSRPPSACPWPRWPPSTRPRRWRPRWSAATRSWPCHGFASSTLHTISNNGVTYHDAYGNPVG